METTDWLASRNLFRVPMLESVANGMNIAIFSYNVLNLHKDDADPGFLARFTETETVINIVISALGIKGTINSVKLAQTQSVQTMYAEIPAKIRDFEDLVIPVYKRSSIEFKSIFGPDHKRFNTGSYQQKETAIQSVSGAMDRYTGLTTISAEVMDYYDNLVASRQIQQGLISGFKTDSAELRNAMENMILQMDRNLGWLKFFYARILGGQALINAFFALDLIINHADNKIYPHSINKGAIKAVCRRDLKETDIIRITIDGPKDVMFYTAPNTKSPYTPDNSFRGKAGEIIEKPQKEVFPDVKGKQIMAYNPDPQNDSHFIFEIIVAKK